VAVKRKTHREDWACADSPAGIKRRGAKTQSRAELEYINSRPSFCFELIIHPSTFTLHPYLSVRAGEIVAQIGNLPFRRLVVGKPKVEGRIMNDETNASPFRSTRIPAFCLIHYF
jgi:hypothetical protein